MATSARRRAPARSIRATGTPPPQPATDLGLARQRRQIEYIAVDDITPYPFNPRDNEKAIPAVAASIKNFGFLVPCVIDDNNVLVAGHTRTEAAKLLGLDEVPCIRASGLTQEQINAFRLIDNKVAEQAEWNFDLLAGEMSKIGELGLDFTEFGWTQEEVDCLSEVVAADCLTAEESTQQAESEAAANSQRRSPQQARVVIGEVVFFVTAQQYRIWVDGVRQLHNFNETAIADDLKRRLGFTE